MISSFSGLRAAVSFSRTVSATRISRFIPFSLEGGSISDPPGCLASTGTSYHTHSVKRDSTESAVPPYGARQQPIRGCDHPGCEAWGEHRAPRSRTELNDYLWFCLEHVRAYNSSWNYCAGMSTEEVERNIRRDTVWRRPSWRFGTGQPLGGVSLEDVEDALGILGIRRRARPAAAPDVKDGRVWPPVSPEGRALRTLELIGPVTLAVVKARYKELAKRLHPDANGGCKKSEDRLKSVNAAYVTLRKSLTA